MFRTNVEGRRRGGRKLLWAQSILMSLAVVVLMSGCEDLQRPKAQDSDFEAAYNPAQGTLEFKLEAISGEASAIRLLASEVYFDPQTGMVHAQVSLRNAGPDPIPGPVGVWVHGFVPESIAPANAECLRIPEDPPPARGACLYRHEGTYGEDDVLSPGETSAPIEWMLHNPEGVSFGFRAMLEPGPGSLEGVISGVVYEDLNGNGQRENNEPGIAGVRVTLEFDEQQVETQSDVNGRYAFDVEGPGLYEVDAEPLEDWQVTTPHPLQVVIIQRPDGSLSRFTRGDFGCTRGGPVPAIRVTGIVYEDLNRNGRLDLGEPGMPGIWVDGAALQCPTFVPIRAQTDRMGRYVMRLPLCDPPYVIGREPLPGFIDTSPNPIFFAEMPGDSALRADFGAARGDSTCLRSESTVLEVLEKAYEQRDVGVFSRLLASGPTASFIFLLDQPTSSGETAWGVEEERRIHRRMFQPDSIPPGDQPVPRELWLNSIQVTLIPMAPFNERPDLYRSPMNPEGLDPARWRASDARYGYEVFFDTQGNTDYRAVGMANFVVIQDLLTNRCGLQSFLLYRWEDLGTQTVPGGLFAGSGSSRSAVEEASWSSLKQLYR